MLENISSELGTLSTLLFVRLGLLQQQIQVNSKWDKIDFFANLSMNLLNCLKTKATENGVFPPLYEIYECLKQNTIDLRDIVVYKMILDMYEVKFASDS